VVGSTTPPTVFSATLCTAPTLQTPYVTSNGAVITATYENQTTGSYNSELDELQFSGGYSNGRWKRLRLVWTSASGGTQTQIVSGIGVDPPVGTKR
jgi:hypothetical protein